MIWTIKKGFYRIIHKFENLFVARMTSQEPTLLTGPGSIKKLYTLIQSEGACKPLVVTDKGLTNLKIHDEMFQTFNENNIEYVVFDDVLPNPTINMVETAKNVFLENKCDCMIGFGGGSPMDCAKIALGLIAKPGKKVRDLGRFFTIKNDVPPFFAVPTTSGTGSETTFGGVITDPDTHEKFAIASIKLLPKYAVLDPELTLGLPPHITSTTGMDTLTHAVESYINIIGDASSDENAMKAVKIVFDNLVNLYKNGNQIEAREEMSRAAYYGGLVMGRAMLGYVHAIAHKLGGMYNIPHGLANAIILPCVLEYYGAKIHKKLSNLAIFAGIGNENESISTLAEKFIQAIYNMNKTMNIPSSIDEINIDDIDIIAKAALKEANPTYPVPKIMNMVEMKELIKKLKSK